MAWTDEKAEGKRTRVSRGAVGLVLHHADAAREGSARWKL